MKFVNTELFRTEAIAFLKQGYYCADPWGSPAWREYWEEQHRRCIEGYSVGGVRITGEHYGYLNFAQIMLTQTKEEEKAAEAVVKDKKASTGARKVRTFPDFWDGDYNYFHAVEIAEKGITQEELDKLGLAVNIKPEDMAGGKHLCVGKSRRKGYSYKNAWKCANRYNTIRESITIIGAFDKKYLYPKGTMQMTSDYLNFVNEHTGWAKKRQYVDKIDHKKASFEVKQKGIPIEKGYKSEIIAITFKDNPDAARGKDASLILLEEAGKFSNLKASYLATKPSVEDGIYTTGQIIIFGTGGDMQSGTVDFNEMFYNPEPYNLMAFENIWDEGARNTHCSFYVPDYMNKPGFIDQYGNSLQSEARHYEEAKRESIARTAKDKVTLNKHITEYAFCPKESFLRLSGNIFPVADLNARLTEVETSNRLKNSEYIGRLLIDEEDDDIYWSPDEKVKPIYEFPIKADADKEGAVVIYEQPIEDEELGHPIYNRYIAGIDPYDQDDSGTGSLGSTIVFDRLTNRIVAEYTGRPETAKAYYEQVRRLLLYYNAVALYENERKGIFDYFEYRNSLHLLADEPELIRDVIQRSTVNRKKGMHMTSQLKDYGEELIKSWLIDAYEAVPGETEGVLNLHKIRCIPLLREMIAYHDEGNFDRVMSFMMVMYYMNELRKQRVEEKNNSANDIWEDPFFKRDPFAVKKRRI